MLNVMENAVRMAAEMVARHGEWITVSRADGVQCELRAMPSKPEQLIDDPNAMTRLGHEDLDWRFRAADLMFDGVPSDPIPGMTIQRQQPVETFEIRPRGRDQCFSRCDPLGQVILVRSKRTT